MGYYINMSGEELLLLALALTKLDYDNLSDKQIACADNLINKIYSEAK